MWSKEALLIHAITWQKAQTIHKMVATLLKPSSPNSRVLSMALASFKGPSHIQNGARPTSLRAKKHIFARMTAGVCSITAGSAAIFRIGRRSQGTEWISLRFPCDFGGIVGGYGYEFTFILFTVIVRFHVLGIVEGQRQSRTEAVRRSYRDCSGGRREIVRCSARLQ